MNAIQYGSCADAAMLRCLLLLGTTAATFIWNIPKRIEIPPAEESRLKELCAAKVGWSAWCWAYLKQFPLTSLLQRQYLRNRPKRLDAYHDDRLTEYLRAHLIAHSQFSWKYILLAPRNAIRSVCTCFAPDIPLMRLTSDSAASQVRYPLFSFFP